MPALSLSIDAAKMFQAFERIPLIAARELRTELSNACDVVRNDARINHRFKSGTGHSGHLEKSITKEVSASGLEGRVYLNKGVAAYGAPVHEGSKPHKIYPKNKKALFFVKGGKSFMVMQGSMSTYAELAKKGIHLVRKGYVNHPGTKPDKFLYQAFERQKPFIIARVKAAVSRVFQMAGVH